MPRLPNADYLRLHRNLRWLWLDHSQAYGYLSSTQQWDLHRFFVPSKDLTDEQLIEHRRAITIEFPSLPQRAGRALARLNRVGQQVSSSQGAGRRISV